MLNPKDQKIRTAIEKILGAWPMLRGVVETGWKEMEFRKLDEIWDFVDDKKYQFHKMTNKDIEKAMVEELYLQVTRKLIRLQEHDRRGHPRILIHIHDRSLRLLLPRKREKRLPGR